MAGLTIAGDPCVDRCRRFGGEAKAGIEVTARALAGHSHVGVQFPGIPTTETSLVAAVAVGRRSCRDGFVGYVA